MIKSFLEWVGVATATLTLVTFFAIVFHSMEDGPSGAAQAEEPTSPPDPLALRAHIGHVKIWVDPETGCQYLATSPRGSYDSLALVPRTGRDGLQVCSPIVPRSIQEPPLSDRPQPDPAR